VSVFTHTNPNCPVAPLETIGLFGFAWTSLGPPHVHWIAPMFFSALVGIANYAIYMGTIDYMIAAYGPVSRPFLAFFPTLPSWPDTYVRY
jgi:hypothetical protein